MARKRILVVEDDEAVREGLVDAMDFEGYQTFEAGTFEDANRAAVSTDVDLVLLDLVLPGGSGLDVLKTIRSTRPTLPVIILTALGQEDDRVTGLKLGADDYVLKPFSLKELVARVEAVLRRSAERPTDVAEVTFPGGTADLAKNEIRYDDGDRVELSEREVSLLRYLSNNAGRVISRDELLERVWRIPSAGVRTRTIDVHVGRLRDKLRDEDPDQPLIQTVRGRGYVFKRSE
ncbi:MAG: response regulator transcription factor [Deltaproteobacteria bacterium]|jgi:DNA-binding response OmpR family regulator